MARAVYGKIFLKAAGRGLAHTGYELAHDLRRPDLYLARNAAGIFDAAVCLLSEIDRLEQLDKAVLSGEASRISAEAQSYMEHRQAQAARVNAVLQDLKQMPWDSFVEYGFAAGSRMFADIFALKGICLGAAAIKTIAPKIDAFLDAARAEKSVALANGIKAPGAETFENFAFAGKVAAEEGVEVAQEAVSTIAKNPEIVKAEGGFVPAVKRVANAANERGKAFEDFLVKRFGGRGSFRVKSANTSREFDGAYGNVWYEAKSGKYWDMLKNNPKFLDRFRERMISGLSIASENGVRYELYSNSPIPQEIKNWLIKKGIPFVEFLEGK